MKKQIVLLLMLLPLGCYVVNAQEAEIKKKNSVELATLVANSTHFNFIFNSRFQTKIRYNRYIGKFFKTGVSYNYFKDLGGTKINEFGMNAGVLILPMLIKNSDITNSIEVEFRIHYALQYKKYIYKGMENKYYDHSTFARLGIAKRLKNNIFIISDIDIWKRNGIYIGLRYAF